MGPRSIGATLGAYGHLFRGFDASLTDALSRTISRPDRRAESVKTGRWGTLWRLPIPPTPFPL